LSEKITAQHIMSFETTGTIASFGGKLLKLAHQVGLDSHSTLQTKVQN